MQDISSRCGHPSFGTWRWFEHRSQASFDNTLHRDRDGYPVHLSLHYPRSLRRHPPWRRILHLVLLLDSPDLGMFFSFLYTRSRRLKVVLFLGNLSDSDSSRRVSTAICPRAQIAVGQCGFGYHTIHPVRGKSRHGKGPRLPVDVAKGAANAVPQTRRFLRIAFGVVV